MNRKVFRRVSAWKILLWACLGMLIGLVLAQLALTVSELRHIDASSVQALQRAEDAARATGDALRRAEASPFQHCSDDDLAVLRNIAYANSYVADLGRVDQGMVRCTALWGQLAEPFVLPEPLYQAGRGFKIWLGQAIVHTHAPSNVVGLQRSLALTAPTTFDLNRFYQDVSLRITSADGAHVLVEREGMRYNPDGAIGLLPGIDVTHCNADLGLCARASARLHWYPVLYPRGLIALLAGSFVAGALACLLHLRSRRHQGVLDRLRHGIANDEIVLLYQPIVCINDLSLKGYEALARWRPADEPEIGPDIFVPLAVQNRLCTPLAKVVFARALREMQALLLANPDLILAINTEVADIEDANFIRFVLELTANHAALRRQLHLEVTERADIRSDAFTHNIELLRRVGFAIWRETLIDAAIFREAITNNSSRTAMTRMAHLFCELYYRARAAGLTRPVACHLPFHQGQIGEALAMSIVTVNRTIQTLRRTRAMEFRNGNLTVLDWKKLTEVGDFDPNYLNLKKPARL